MSFILKETFKALITALFIFLFAIISFHYFDKKLIEHQTRQGVERDNLKYKIDFRDELLVSANTLYFKAMTMKMYHGIVISFKNSEPNDSAVENAMMSFTEILDEDFISYEDTLKSVSILTKCYIILDKDYCELYRSLFKSIFPNPDKTLKIMERGVSLLVDHEKYKNLIGKKAIMADSTINAMINLLNIDTDDVEENYLQLFKASMNGGVLKSEQNRK